MSRKTVEQFNDHMEEYGFKLSPKTDYNGKLYGYDLLLKGREVYLPSGFDVTSITQKDFNLKWKHNK